MDNDESQPQAAQVTVDAELLRKLIVVAGYAQTCAVGPLRDTITGIIAEAQEVYNVHVGDGYDDVG